MRAIVYLSIDPQKAKEENLPVSLPLLIEDFDIAVKENKISPDMIVRGLEAQIQTGEKVDYYLSYLVYFLYDRARAFMNENDLAKAKEYIEKAASYKRDYRYPLHLGIMERMSGNLERAEIILKEAISMNSLYVPSRIELARTLMNEDEFEDAIDACKKAIEIDPSFTLSYVVMGDAYMALGDSRSAISLYEQALSIDRDLSSVHWRIGVAANALQKFSLAEKEFRISLSKKEGGWQSEYNLSYSLYRQGKIFEAIQILHSLEKRGIREPAVITELLILQKMAGFYEEALETVEDNSDYSIDEKGFILASIDTFAFNGMMDRAMKLCDELLESDAGIRKKLLALQDDWNTQIDLMELAKFIDRKDQQISKKIEEVLNGIISEEKAFDISMLLIVNEIIKIHGTHPYSAESILTRAAISFSGDADMLALFIFIYRLYLYTHAFEQKPEEAIEQLIPSITDISWRFGEEIVKILENDKSFSLEEVAENGFDRPLKVAKFLIASIIILKDEKESSKFLTSIDTPKVIIELFEKIMT